MNSSEFANFLTQKANQVKDYARNSFAQKAGEISLRFIDDNFKKQGWDAGRLPWKPLKKQREGGSILIKTGTLRRGNYFTKGDGMAHVMNNVKYADIHNAGFNGTVTIKAHQRRKLISKKTATGRAYKGGKRQTQTIHSVSGISDVKQHQRRVNIPKRKFFPSAYNDGQVLEHQLRTQLINDLVVIKNTKNKS